MCKFCGEERAIMDDEYGEYEARIVKIIPLAPINLTNGEIAETTEPPYFVIFVGIDVCEREEASFPINFCPMCGKRLFIPAGNKLKKEKDDDEVH